MNQVIYHYDSLIDENNDPACDPKPAQEYMNKWDGQVFIDELELSTSKTVLEIGVGTGRLALKVCGKCKSFVGIDISPKTIERAKENLTAFTIFLNLKRKCIYQYMIILTNWKQKLLNILALHVIM